jgi:hypothetical protein
MVFAISGCGLPDASKPQPATSEIGRLAVSPSKAEVRALLQADQFKQLNERMSAVQSDYRQGRIDGDQLCASFRVFYDADPTLLAKYEQWVAAFPRSYVALLARGIYHRKVGQALRGGEFIAGTSASQL